MFEELADCETCPLRESKRIFGPVPCEAIGDQDNIEAVFIGIAPAKDELRQKRPMIGYTGKFGREEIKKAGYKNYLLTNCMACWYPDQATDAHLKKATECCRPRLEAELKLFKPKAIITFGAIPTAGILKFPGIDFPITTHEGLPQESDYGTVVPVRQPAAVSRRPDEYTDFKIALDNGLRILNGTWTQPLDPITTVLTKDTLWEGLERINRSGSPAIDTETTKDGFYPYKRNPDKIRCISFAVDPTEGFIIPRNLLDDLETKADIKQCLEANPGTYHNGMFDCGFFYQEGIYPQIRYDTLLAHYMIDERGYAHGLKRLTQRILGAPPWEKEIQQFLPTNKSSYDLIPDESLFPYAARDVCYLLPLEEEFQRSVPATGNGVMARLLLPAAQMFNEIRHKGLRLDLEKLMSLDTGLDVEVDELERELQGIVGYPLNASSAPEVAHYLYDILALPQANPPNKPRTTNKKYIRQFEDVEEVQKVIEVREAKKLKGTYILGVAKFLDYDWRIHPFTKLFGAETGRISTEDPSVMNVSKKGGIKSMYLPEEGEYLLEVDLSGGELRCYAVVTKDEKLREMLRHGDQVPSEDVHNTVAREIAERIGRPVGRGPAKTGVFGRMYGRGIAAFEAGFRLDRTGAVQVVGIIDEMIPTLPKYNNWVKRQILENGELVSYFGRRRRFPYLPTKSMQSDAFREGGNFLIQSMCSDVNLFAMLFMWAQRFETGAVPMFPVHDSVIFSVKDPMMALRVKWMMESYITELIGGEVAFLTEAKIGTNWGNTIPVIGICDCAVSGRHWHLGSTKEGMGSLSETRRELEDILEFVSLHDVPLPYLTIKE